MTQSVKIINPNSQKLRLTDVRLMGGAQSYFAINIDGSPGPEQDNIDLGCRGQSLYFCSGADKSQFREPSFYRFGQHPGGFQWQSAIYSIAGLGAECEFSPEPGADREYGTGDTTLPYVIQGGLADRHRGNADDSCGVQGIFSCRCAAVGGWEFTGERHR